MNKSKNIITIGRQFGSGGKEIAMRLGERLGMKVYDKELINEAARRSGLSSDVFEMADERASKSRLMTLLGSRTALESFGSIESGSPLSNDKLFQIQSEAIKQIANEGNCIFIGRCADYILRERRDVINVFISAQREQRIERVAKRLSLTLREAENVMQQSEKQRSDYYNFYTFKTWGAAESYHLCVDTSSIGIDATVDMIAMFAERFGCE